MKVVASLAISANGMIADKNGNTPWSKELWQSYIEIVNKFDNMIVGHTTYDIMKQAGDFKSFAKRPHMVVLSREPLTPNAEYEVAANPKVRVLPNFYFLTFVKKIKFFVLKIFFDR